LTASWAAFAAQLRYERLPAQVVPVLKGLVLDTLGASLAASTLGDGCAQVVKLVRSNPGAPEATVLGHGDRVSSLLAAFANGALAHALNFDALGGAGGHTGVASVIAPLVMAEKTGGVSGREFLTAVAVAAEFTARLAGALSAAGVDANEKFLEGQLLSYFGAAAGAGRILRFTPERMHDVLGFALMQAAGTRQVSFEGGEAKAIYGAYTNQGAVMSVLLAEQGIGARCAVLDGRAGIYALFYGGKYDAAFLHDGLGEKFHAADTVFKPWATSGVLHPFIEACLALRNQHRVDAADIAGIHLKVSAYSRAWIEPAEERRRPHNAATAANSIFFGVAKTLANGNVALADFTPEGLAQPEPLALAAAMRYSEDADQEIEITLRNGRVLKAPVGGKTRPLSYEQLAAKFRDCAQHAARPVAASVLEEVIERVANLEKQNDVAVVPALLAGSTMSH
jgi:2-methylcitrate dehydratase PrpD